MTAASVPRRQFPIHWIGWAATALLIVVFVIQLPFFFAWGSHFPLSYAFNYGWAFVILAAVTAMTKTVRIRMLVAFWFVGVYLLIGVVLLIGVPLLQAFGPTTAAIPGFVLPLLEELVKPLPIIGLFAFAARRRYWELSASDGALLGFMAGAGFAFHEDMMFGRVWGSGPGDTPLSWIFPTLYSFRGVTSPYHEIWLALVGLALGAAFMLRTRTRLAWVIPIGAWLIVFTEHWTGNYLADPFAAEPIVSVASTLNGFVLGGLLSSTLLVIGLIIAVGAEFRILKWMTARDRLFRPVALREMAQAAQAVRSTGWRRLQALRDYERRRRSALYTLWIAQPVEEAADASAMGNALVGLAQRAALTPRTARAAEGEGGASDSGLRE